MADAAEATKPLYLRMQEDLLRRVQSGEWRPGELLPSENALAAEYGVSVGTARKAIEDLADRRLLVRQRGRGTTVAMHTHRQEVLRHYRLVSATGERVNENTAYLDVTPARASAVEAKALGINRGTAVARVRRLRTYRTQPVVVEYLTLREDLLPGIGALIDASRPEVLYSMLERQFHIIIGKVQEKVTAVRAEAADVELLGVELGEPMLEIERIAFDLRSLAVERRIMRARGDTHYLSEFA
ncbi:GntR family transcriptional regulator [Starkeya koreensis]|uniref:GntR family transcriptional regulator n=1 Tax=Ancylobacter koreensis TaxID=266121 RepID=A0ABT0DJP2_9HYPH|nr:GntR family transcriptional regulator [Ancylobacter koreensis]MCK0207505.1 GntR family transcriptional regulator [Ancylobacter koreensis]